MILIEIFETYELALHFHCLYGLNRRITGCNRGEFTQTWYQKVPRAFRRCIKWRVIRPWIIHYPLRERRSIVKSDSWARVLCIFQPIARQTDKSGNSLKPLEGRLSLIDATLIRSLNVFLALEKLWFISSGVLFNRYCRMYEEINFLKLFIQWAACIIVGIDERWTYSIDNSMKTFLILFRRSAS